MQKKQIFSKQQLVSSLPIFFYTTKRKKNAPEHEDRIVNNLPQVEASLFDVLSRAPGESACRKLSFGERL